MEHGTNSLEKSTVQWLMGVVGGEAALGALRFQKSREVGQSLPVYSLPQSDLRRIMSSEGWIFAQAANGL
jgi:hypothetical protein